MIQLITLEYLWSGRTTSNTNIDLARPALFGQRLYHFSSKNGLAGSFLPRSFLCTSTMQVSQAISLIIIDVSYLMRNLAMITMHSVSVELPLWLKSQNVGEMFLRTKFSWIL